MIIKEYFDTPISFEDYIKSVVNPQRILNGLLPISEEEIVKCRQILEDFRKKWNE